MYYKESGEILKAVKSAGKILIISHKNPDADSIGSILGLFLALSKLGIKADACCVDEVPGYLLFLPAVSKITKVDFRKLEFQKYSLIMVLDSSSWEQITEAGAGLEKIKGNTMVLVIDHHASNKVFGKINLVVKDASSTSEIIYRLLTDWNVKVNSDIANNLLAGIIGDTGSFRFPKINADVFEVAADLIRKGANRDKIIKNLFFSADFKELKFLSEILKSSVLDKKNKIIWSAVPYERYLRLGKPDGVGFSGTFFQGVKGTKIGVYMVEKEKNVLDVSLRARENYDVSKIAIKLGGGGHKRAAGATVRGLKFKDAVCGGLKFKDAVCEVLDVIRENLN